MEDGRLRQVVTTIPTQSSSFCPTFFCSPSSKSGYQTADCCVAPEVALTDSTHPTVLHLDSTCRWFRFDSCPLFLRSADFTRSDEGYFL